MRLWIDDIRPAPTGFVWVKTVKEAKAAIIQKNGWREIRSLEVI